MLRRDFIRNLGGLTASGLLLPGLDIAGSRALAQGERAEAVRRHHGRARHADAPVGDGHARRLPAWRGSAGARAVSTRPRAHTRAAAADSPPTVRALHVSSRAMYPPTMRPSTPPSTRSSRDETPPRSPFQAVRFCGSLQAGVGVRGTGGRATLIYEAKGAPIAPENDPAALFDRIFGGGPIGEGGAGADTPELRLDLKQSILDVHRAELSAIAAHAGAEDRERLELHTDAIRDPRIRPSDLRNGARPVRRMLRAQPVCRRWRIRWQQLWEDRRGSLRHHRTRVRLRCDASCNAAASFRRAEAAST